MTPEDFVDWVRANHPGWSMLDAVRAAVEAEREAWKVAIRSVRCVLPDDTDIVETAAIRARRKP